MFDRQEERNLMVDRQILGRGIKNQAILDAMREIPRHIFIDEALSEMAYMDCSMPVVDRQTMTQPFMVALMVQVARITAESNVLEIGTGSGYSTAVLSRVAGRVFSVERSAFLYYMALENLEALNCRNVRLKNSDGTFGWKEEGPFDAVIVCAGSPIVPIPLVDQLRIGGRLVIPLGTDHFLQELVLLTRTEKGLSRKCLGGCHFVDLVGQYGWAA